MSLHQHPSAVSDASSFVFGSSSKTNALGTLERVVTRLLSTKQTAIVAVCGMGGTGKSTLCRTVAEHFPKDNVFWFETDWYCTKTSAQRRSEIFAALKAANARDLEHAGNMKNWYNWPAIVSALLRLKNTGELSLIDGWNQRTGNRDLNLSVNLEAPRVILCDGIFLLDSHMTQLFDRVVLLETSREEAARRRLRRDFHRAPAPYLAIKDELIRMFVEPYFEHYRGSADMLLRT